MRRIAAQVVFTTHTPVPAGHDRFSPDLVEEHLGPLREALGLGRDELHGARPRRPYEHHETFCMTVLALKLSRRANAVSSLHGQVSRAMWTPLFPAGRSDEQVPIGHITNGVHVRTLARAADAPGLRPPPRTGLAGAARAGGCWEAIDGIDDGELWETHQTLKTALIEFARRRAARCAGAARRARGVRRAAAARAQPRRADDRLRAALRHLQARQPDPAGHRERSSR